MTDIVPVCVWGIGAVLFLIVIPVAAYWQEVKTRLMTPNDILSARFKAAYPLIRELSEAKPPYSSTKVEALHGELNSLRIMYPVDHARWPEYLRELRMLAKKGKLEKARTLPEYLDTTP